MVSTRSMARAQNQSPQGSASILPSVTKTSKPERSSPGSKSRKKSREDAGQRPIRRKFKKASLEENQGSTHKGDTSSDSNPNSQKPSGSESDREERVGKKRSFDEVNTGDNVEIEKASRRGRKRSRSSETEAAAPKRTPAKGDNTQVENQKELESGDNDRADSKVKNNSDINISVGSESSAPPIGVGGSGSHVRRKRSHDGLEGDENGLSETTSKHVRKRSKSSDDDGRVNKDLKPIDERLSGPAIETEGHVKGDDEEKYEKRVRDDDISSGSKAENNVVGQPPVSTLTDLETERTLEPQSQQMGTSKASRTAPGAGSGFANTAAESPFSSLLGETSSEKEQQTSSEAFASSGFASFVSQSPFASVNTSASPFAAASGAQSKIGGSSSFGTEAKSSAFGTQSGFGQLGSTIGSKPLFGGKSSAFGLPVEPEEKETQKAEKNKPAMNEVEANSVEAPVSRQSEVTIEQDEGSEDEGTGLFHEAKAQDSRFFEQDVETGEEEEETRFEARAKLFVNTGKEWKERGVGLFKVNVMDGDADVDTGKPKLRARFIMRADGTHRVSINSPITPEVQIQDKDGAEPKQNTVFFMGAIDGKMRLCLLRLRNADLALDLYDVVQTIKADLL